MEFEGNSSLHAVTGAATGITGFLEFALVDGRIGVDPAPQIQITIPVAKLSSGNAVEDSEMRRLVGGSRFPTITAKVSNLTPLDGSDRYTVSGEVTANNTTREYTGDVRIVVVGDKVSMEGERIFDIRDFGIQPPRLFVFSVQPEFKVRLSVQGQRE